MPLLAYGVDGAVFHAWAMSPSAWEELKVSYRDRGLTAPCCGAAVVPVRSPTGWQFFRHKPNTVCAVRESLTHIVCKSIMARAAVRLGLDVTTEARADDGAWVADVLVRHPDRTVALEAQLSRIPLAAIQDRQERYRQAGIRGAWLVGYDIAGFEARRDLPLFRLEVKQAERLEPAVIGSPTAGAPGRTELGKFMAGVEFLGNSSGLELLHERWKRVALLVRRGRRGRCSISEHLRPGCRVRGRLVVVPDILQ